MTVDPLASFEIANCPPVLANRQIRRHGLAGPAVRLARLPLINQTRSPSLTGAPTVVERAMTIGELLAEAMDPVVAIAAAVMCALLALDALLLVCGP